MARISSFVTLGASALLALAASVTRADGVAYPAAPTSGPVYGGWTTPQPGGYGNWTTPRPPSYGTWTTPPPGGYGTWTTPPGSARSYGAPSVPSVPSSATVATPGPSTGWSAPAYAPVATIDEPCVPRALRFGASARYWRPSISGDVLITAGGEPGSGTSADVERDLGLDTGDGFEGGVSASYGRHRATFGYESDSFSGTNRLGRAIVYHGVTFPAGTDVRSDVNLTFWKLGYDYAFVVGSGESSALTVRGGVSGWLWSYEGRVRSTTPSADTARAFSHLLPVATLAAEGAFDRFRVGARLAAGWLASDRYVLDAEASVGYQVCRAASIDLGYRFRKFSFHETTNEAVLTLAGPFASVSLEF